MREVAVGASRQGGVAPPNRLRQFRDLPRRAFAALLAKGARCAATVGLDGNEESKYSDVLYIDNLIGTEQSNRPARDLTPSATTGACLDPREGLMRAALS